MEPRGRHDGRHPALLLAIPALAIAVVVAWTIVLAAAWSPVAVAVSLAVTVAAVAAPAWFLHRARRRSTGSDAMGARL